MNGVDIGVIKSVIFYVKYGLAPGGFCCSVILDRLDEARRNCHPHALQVFENTVNLIKLIVPDYAGGNDDNMVSWLNHNGMSGASEELKLQYRLSHREVLEELNFDQLMFEI